MMKCGYAGTLHHMSRKHLPCYVNEFAGRHNVRSLDTSDQPARMAQGSVGRRLPWREPVASTI